MNRRDFVQNAMAGALVSAAQPSPAAAAASKMIGIQVGAVSFVDEGVNTVLDLFQQAASVNTLFVATFTYGRGNRGAAGSRPAAAGSRQAGVRHRDVQGRELYAGASAVLQGHSHPGFPRAGFRRLRRARGGAAGGPQARHEDDLLVRGRVESATSRTSRRRRRSASTGPTRRRCASTIRITATGCWARWRTTRARTRSTGSCGGRSGRARSPMRWARAMAGAEAESRGPRASASSASRRRRSAASIRRAPGRDSRR